MEVRIATLLLGIAGLVVYWFCFYLVSAKAGAEEVRRYSKKVPKHKINLVGVSLLVGSFFIPYLPAAIVVLLLAFAWIGKATLDQKHKMKELGFSPVYTQQLFAISFMVPPFVSLLFASTWLFRASGT
jgi:hypothetical protein